MSGHVSVMSRSSKVVRVLSSSGRRVPDDFGVFGRVFVVSDAYYVKQVRVIEVVE